MPAPCSPRRTCRARTRSISDLGVLGEILAFLALIWARASDLGRRGGSRAVAAASFVVLAVTSSPVAHASDAPPPRAATPDSFLHDLVRDIRERIDAVIVARAPTLVPPQKIDVRWRLAKLGSLDLGAPLVALAGGDLDGDRKAELYAVTAREVIAIGLRGKKLEELGRVAFTGQPALPMPRDVVGTATIDGNALVASVSTSAPSMRVSWQGGVLVAAPGEPGFVLCPGVIAQLVPGRNYFGDATGGHYGIRCRAGLVESDGRPVRTRAQLGLDNKLEVHVERCAALNIGCKPATKYEYADAGVAFEVADVDRDGRPEAIYSGAGAPGDPDLLKIVSFGDDDRRQPRLKKAFSAGGIAGLAVADLDGSGAAEVIAAVRLVGATRVDLWRVE